MKTSHIYLEQVEEKWKESKKKKKKWLRFGPLAMRIGN